LCTVYIKMTFLRLLANDEVNLGGTTPVFSANEQKGLSLHVQPFAV
jgi:hypothetical protein